MYGMGVHFHFNEDGGIDLAVNNGRIEDGGKGRTLRIVSYFNSSLSYIVINIGELVIYNHNILHAVEGALHDYEKKINLFTACQRLPGMEQ